jgi:mRNA-degrading endonuclease YafQ of YafQ-DinJ toxin-antitoxin module
MQLCQISGKNVGKSIQRALEEGNLDHEDLENMLNSLGVDENMVSKIVDYALSGEFKKAGKAVTRLIDNGQFTVDDIINMAILDYSVKEIDTDALCQRCGAVLNDEECSECGFYNML